MAKCKGVYINLKDSRERKQLIEESLNFLKQEGKYSRHEGIRGKKEEAEERHLSKGEVGIWKTWIEILEEESKGGDYDYLHILEDDARLSKECVEFMSKLSHKEPQFDLLFTDMYVNPQVYNLLYDKYCELKNTKKMQILDGSSLYTGCLSSVLIHRSKISKILKILSKIWHNSASNLLPLDNEMVKLARSKNLRVGITAPFITSVDASMITKSTIQQSTTKDERIQNTQNYCTNLRQSLSTLHDWQISELTSTLCKILSSGNTEKARKNKIISRSIAELNKVIVEEEVCYYLKRPKLYGQPDNKQS